ncbi:methylenetetrahydrofolate reductase [Morganella morganii]
MMNGISFEINAVSGDKKGSQLSKEMIEFTDTLNPLFYSVNTEIGITPQIATFDTCMKLKLYTGKKIIPHIAINNKDECELDYIISSYMNAGIRSFFLIRGDKHIFSAEKSFNYAIDLIRYCREHFREAEIRAAIYPDFYKETVSPAEELYWIKEKSALGISEFICQFCMNSDAICHLKQTAGNDIRIAPSLFPLVNFSFIEKFTKENGIDYPLWIKKIITDPSLRSVTDKGIALTRFFTRSALSESGRLHFFTLNNFDLLKRIFSGGKIKTAHRSVLLIIKGV